jgi:hypothetical protein
VHGPAAIAGARRALLAVIVACCAACGSHRAQVRVFPRDVTRPAPGDRVAVQLGAYEGDAPEEKARSVERCVAVAAQGQQPDIAFTPWVDVAAVLARAGRPPPRSAQELRAALADPAALEGVRALGVRYVVFVDLKATATAPSTELAWGPGAGCDSDPLCLFVWGFTSTKRKTKTWSGHVVDLARADGSGRVDVVSHGDSGWGMIFLLVLPLPPFPVLALTGTDWHACGLLGEGVAQLLVTAPVAADATLAGPPEPEPADAPQAGPAMASPFASDAAAR